MVVISSITLPDGDGPFPLPHHRIPGLAPFGRGASLGGPRLRPALFVLAGWSPRRTRTTRGIAPSHARRVRSLIDSTGYGPARLNARHGNHLMDTVTHDWGTLAIFAKDFGDS